MSWDCEAQGHCGCADDGYGCCYCDYYQEPSYMTENGPAGTKPVTDDVEAGDE